jgi:hypothetical protein
MSQSLVLLNPITVTLRGQQHKLLPGEVIADPVVQNLVTEGGGYLVQATAAALAGASVARRFQAKGADPTTQALIMLAALESQQGTPASLSAVLTTVTHGTPVTGTPQTIVAIPTGGVAILTVNAVGKVTKVGTGGSESLTDYYSIQFRCTAANPNGTVVVGGTATPEGVPWIDAMTSMSDASVNVAGSGGNAQITFGNGAKIGSGAQVTWTFSVSVRIS